MNQEYILETRSLTKEFSGFVAVNNVKAQSTEMAADVTIREKIGRGG